MASLAAGISRSPRQVDSRFILILVDVVTAPVVTNGAAEGDLVLVEELEATACDGDGLVIILTGDWIYTLTAD